MPVDDLGDYDEEMMVDEDTKELLEEEWQSSDQATLRMRQIFTRWGRSRHRFVLEVQVMHQERRAQHIPSYEDVRRELRTILEGKTARTRSMWETWFIHSTWVKGGMAKTEPSMELQELLEVAGDVAEQEGQEAMAVDIRRIARDRKKVAK